MFRKTAETFHMKNMAISNLTAINSEVTKQIAHNTKKHLAKFFKKEMGLS